jgi:hypothetical protein
VGQAKDGIRAEHSWWRDVVEGHDSDLRPQDGLENVDRPYDKTDSIADLPSSQRPVLQQELGLISPSRMELSAGRVQGEHFAGGVQLHEKPKGLDDVLGH